MPSPRPKTAMLRAETISQLALFGTARNGFDCLRLDPYVRREIFARALCGYPVAERAVALIEARWQEWLREFAADPEAHPIPPERGSRAAGDYFHAEVVRDAETGAMPVPWPRWTLADSAGKWLPS